MSTRRDHSDSGMLVYPKMPVPKPGREDEPKAPRKGGGAGRGLAFGLVALIAGAIGGFFAGPQLVPDPRIDEAELRADAADAETRRLQATAAKLEQEITQLAADKATADTKLTDAQKAQETLASRTAEAQKKAKEAEAVQKKLRAALDKNGTVTGEGETIRLAITDRVLFKAGDDELTPAGKKVLDKVANALKELSSLQIVVEGHTDDQPPPPPPTAPKAAPPKKNAKPVSPAPAPAIRFATNWELASARALAVVHYCQDVHKIDPSRLGALALSQYRPASKSNKAANRRIEIVLSPRPPK